jgi:hypothetical protein
MAKIDLIPSAHDEFLKLLPARRNYKTKIKYLIYVSHK